MQIISIAVLIITAIFTIYEMNKSQEILKNQWFKELQRNDKIKITGFLKGFWKKNIILIALLLCWFLIIISTFMGNGSIYETTLSILAIFYSVITIVIVLKNKKQYYVNINNFKK